MVTGSTPISLLPTGTIDSLRAVFPISIGMPSSANSIRSEMQAVSEFMYMGYTISPSISNSSLTVEIKGVNGNSLSASNPARFQIGNSFYYKTSTANYTLVSGTNWHNAGSSELAAQDVDYFVYAIEETGASAGIKFGHSRIPYAQTMADFSQTSTNEKYIAGSWSTFNSTDKVVNIGRFRATLSSAFAWSIPNSKVINRPIYETDWLSYTPTLTSGSGTITTVGTRTGSYRVIGRDLVFDHSGTITTNGTGATSVRMTIPFTCPSTSAIFAGRENASTGLELQARVATNYVEYFTYANGYPGGSGYTVLGGGCIVRAV